MVTALAVALVWTTASAVVGLLVGPALRRRGDDYPEVDR